MTGGAVSQPTLGMHHNGAFFIIFFIFLSSSYQHCPHHFQFLTLPYPSLLHPPTGCIHPNHYFRWSQQKPYLYLFSIRFLKQFSMLKNKIHLLKRLPSRLFSDENQYEKIKLIGQGTFGKVYLVLNKRTHEQYAVKEVVQDPKYKNRELSIISQLDHPNIVEMKDYFLKMIDGQCTLFILMEYMSTSLQNLVREYRKAKKTFTPVQRKLIAFQLIKGLAYLELNNVCHRDLKPPNILVNTDTFEVKICDFGSAKIIQTKENNVSYICSRYYRAPQLILNSTTYGCEIDMWSAGCIIVELLTLEPVFPGDSSMEQLIEIIKILGTPTREQLAVFSEENASMEIPRVKGNDWSKILKRYAPSSCEIDLIKKILTFDTRQRIRPFQALKHEYFADLVTFEETKSLPELFDFDNLRTKKNKKVIMELQQLYESYRQNLQSDKQNEVTASTVSAQKSTQ